MSIPNELPADFIWVGRSRGGLMRWVFDPGIEHSDEDFVYGYSVTSDDMREYEKSVVIRTLTAEPGGNKAAIEQYLKWKELHGEAFQRNEGHRLETVAVQFLARCEETDRLAARAQEEVWARRNEGLATLRAEMAMGQTHDALLIRNLVTERRIPFLLHFTRIENLPGILETGIVPRSLLPPGFLHNDEKRLDGFPESSSLSVSFPNYLMFYRYRCLNPRANWVVVALSTETLVDQPCLFFPTNAANGRFRNKKVDTLVQRMGFAGLMSMFQDYPVGLRESRRLPEHATTDPQAEILTFDVIAPERIRAVFLMRSDASIETLVRRRRPNIRLLAGGKLFEARADYKFWQAPAKQSAVDCDEDPNEFPF